MPRPPPRRRRRRRPSSCAGGRRKGRDGGTKTAGGCTMAARATAAAADRPHEAGALAGRVKRARVLAATVHIHSRRRPYSQPPPAARARGRISGRGARRSAARPDRFALLPLPALQQTPPLSRLPAPPLPPLPDDARLGRGPRWRSGTAAAAAKMACATAAAATSKVSRAPPRLWCERVGPGGQALRD